MKKQYEIFGNTTRVDLTLSKLVGLKSCGNFNSSYYYLDNGSLLRAD